jgi:hypothetical protein
VVIAVCDAGCGFRQSLESAPGRVRGDRWDGKVSVRSGTARIAIVPSWDDDVPLQEKLAPFPGAQVQVTIPERVTGGPR